MAVIGLVYLIWEDALLQRSSSSDTRTTKQALPIARALTGAQVSRCKFDANKEQG